MSNLTKDEILKPYRRFRLAAVRSALLVTAVMAGAAYALINPTVAQGVLLGGIAGVLGFWLMAVRLEKLANMAPGKVHFAALTGTFLRFILYGAALFRAYTLDREDMHGLLGAVAGILVIRFVTVFMGITGSLMPNAIPQERSVTPGGTQETEEHRE